MDAQNTPIQHFIVFSLFSILVLVLHYALGIEWTVVFARTAYILLFLVLIIGPAVKIKSPKNVPSPLHLPWSWRGELGIWFAISSMIHFVIVLLGAPLSRLIRIGGSGYGLANLMGLVALILTILLAATSFHKVIVFLEVKAWKWIHTFVYVIFYLVTAHMMYFQYFSTHGEVGPDWFGYMGTAMAIIVILLQFLAFFVIVRKNKIKQAKT